jgi:tripartite ATP-independent transporter DctP family solute receptor
MEVEMNKRTLLKLGVATLLAGLGTAAAAQEFSFRAATIGAPGGIQEAALLRLKEVAEERSGGRIAISIATGGALGNQQENLESLQSGTLDIATIETPIVTLEPLLGVLALPYMFRDRAHVDAVMNGEVGDEIREMLREDGVEAIGFYEAGFRHITNNVRPINTPEDLRGVRMRTPESRQRIEIFTAWGADAAPLPYPELYAALQTGAFDGQENPLVEVKSSRFYEVQEYLSLTSHLYQSGYILMSADSFGNLSDDLKAVMIEAATEAYTASVAFGEAADSEVVELAKANGMEVNEADIDAFQAASEAIWVSQTAELGEAATDLIAKVQAAGN